MNTAQTANAAQDAETARTLRALKTERQTILDRRASDDARLAVIEKQIVALEPAEAGAPAPAPVEPSQAKK